MRLRSSPQNSSPERLLVARLSAFGRRLAWLGLASLTALACQAADDDANTEDALGHDGWSETRAERQAVLDTYLAKNRDAFDAFKNRPLGFTGVPYVLLRVIIDRYPEIWSPDAGSLLGLGPHPEDYEPDGTPRPEAKRVHKLPYGFAIEAEDRNAPHESTPVTSSLSKLRDGSLLGSASDIASDYLTETTSGLDKATEKVFFSCGGCHTGRVLVGGKVKHLYGAPSTEIDAQLYTKLLMRTVFEKLVENPEERDPTKIRPNMREAGALLLDMATRKPTWFYGTESGIVDSAKRAVHAESQVGKVLGNAKAVLRGLVATGIKGRMLFEDAQALTHAYIDASGQPAVRGGKLAPPLFGPRPGQMDAYGVASGLVYLHLSRPATMPSFLSDSLTFPDDHPYFAGLTGSREEREQAATARLRASAVDWLPQVPAPVDIKSLFLIGDRFYAGWDGNQGAAARVIASGTSAVGLPEKVSRPMHAQMNGFLSALPPPPYPFAIDRERASDGSAIFAQRCGGCHRENNQTIYAETGADPNRASVVPDDRTRLGLIALMRQACAGESWCTPSGDRAEADAQFYKPLRATGARGYKADALHGIWAQAPYLHNGSVPTLWHMLRPEQRPARFIRGNIAYDEAKVGFVWDRPPSARPGDVVHFSTFDTSLQGQSSGGHTFGADLSEDAKDALTEYLKTL